MNLKRFLNILFILFFIMIKCLSCDAATVKNDNFLLLPEDKSFNRTELNIVEEYNKTPYYHNFKKIDKLIKKEPENANLFVIRGFINLGVHDFLAASNDFDKAISLNNKSDLAYYGKALCCLQYTNSSDFFQLLFLYKYKLNDYHTVHYYPDITKKILSSLKKDNIDIYSAEKSLNKAIEINKNNANYFYFRSFINYLLFMNGAFHQKNVKKSSDSLVNSVVENLPKFIAKDNDLMTALKLNPNMVEAYGLKNKISDIDYDNFEELKKYQEVMQTSIKDNPKYVYPYIWLLYYYNGLLIKDSSKVDALSPVIIEYLSTIKKLDSKNPEVYYIETLFDDSDSCKERFIKSLPFESLSYYEDLFFKIKESGKYSKEDLNIANKIIELSEDKYEGYMYRATIKRGLKDYAGALQDLQTALTYNPIPEYTINIYHDIASDRQDLGDKYGALDTYKYMLNLLNNDDDDLKKALILSEKALLEKELGKYKNALNDFTLAIKLYNIYLKKCEACERDNAIEALSDTYFGRALLYENGFNNLKMAIYDYTQCLKLMPDSSNALYNRGLLYERLNSRQAALADFKKARDLYLKNNSMPDYEDCIEKINYLSR